MTVDLAALPAWLVWGYAAIVGACVGSFLNVVIHRVPRGISVWRPRSACPGCQQPIAAHDNVPVFSWLLLRGRCRRCHTPISVRYALVEAATAFLAVACLHWFGATWASLVRFTLLAAMLAVALIDWEHMIIPDSISLGFLVVGAGAVVLGVPRGGAQLMEALPGGGGDLGTLTQVLLGTISLAGAVFGLLLAGTQAAGMVARSGGGRGKAA